MKLKNLAALIFRILGAIFILDGLAASLGAILDAHGMKAFFDAIIPAISGLMVGYCLIRYSKKLAGIFCKGLDDSQD